MRTAIGAACLLLVTATPARATGGMECRPVRGAGPVLTVGLTHGPVAQVISARLRHGRKEFRTGGHIPAANLHTMIVGQSWVDREEVRLDLLDGQALRFEGQLRARFQPRLRGRPAVGTFVRNGRTWRVRCVEA